MGKITDYWLEQLKPVTDLSKVRDFSEVRGKSFSQNSSDILEKLTLEEKNSIKIRLTEKLFNDFIALFEKNTNSLTSTEELLLFLIDNCKSLFNECAEYAQKNKNPSFYNTQLYWTRLKIRVLLKKSKNTILKNNYNFINQCINIVEQYSRNLVQTIDSEDLSKKIVIVTGFDPFNMGENVDTYPMDNNPSGELALYLHNKNIANTKFYTAIFPVRWEDFDKGIMETFLNQFSFQADSVFTVSLTPSDGIIVDKYAANIRGGGNDNNGQSKSGSIISYPNGFLETTLPYQNTIGKKFGKYQVVLNDMAQVFGESIPKQVNNISQIENKIPVSGSGGDYLSNEIFYRTCKWRNDTKPLSFVPNLKRVVNGHLHVQNINKNNYKTELVNFILAIESTIQSILTDL